MKNGNMENMMARFKASFRNASNLSMGFFWTGVCAFGMAIIGLVLKLFGVEDVGLIRKFLFSISEEWLNMLGLTGTMLLIFISGRFIDNMKYSNRSKPLNVFLIAVTVVVALFVTVKYTDEIFNKFTWWAYGPKLADQLNMASNTWDSWADMNNLFQMLGMYVLNAIAIAFCLQQWRSLVTSFESDTAKLLVGLAALPVYLVVSLVVVWFTFRIFGLILAVIVIIFLLCMFCNFSDAYTCQDRADSLANDGGIAYSDDKDALRYIVNGYGRYDAYTRMIAQDRLDELE